MPFITQNILGKKDWNALPPIARTGIRVAEGVALYMIGKKVYTNIATRQRLKQYQQAGINYTVIGPGGQTAAATVNLASVAQAVYDSITNNDPFGWTEDETRIVNEIKTVPKAFIPELERTYTQLYPGRDLRAEVVQALDSDEWAKISYLFE